MERRKFDGKDFHKDSDENTDEGVDLTFVTFQKIFVGIQTRSGLCNITCVDFLLGPPSAILKNIDLLFIFNILRIKHKHI